MSSTRDEEEVEQHKNTGVMEPKSLFHFVHGMPFEAQVTIAQLNLNKKRFFIQKKYILVTISRNEHLLSTKRVAWDGQTTSWSETIVLPGHLVQHKSSKGFKPKVYIIQARACDAVGATSVVLARFHLDLADHIKRGITPAKEVILKNTYSDDTKAKINLSICATAGNVLRGQKVTGKHLKKHELPNDSQLNEGIQVRHSTEGKFATIGGSSKSRRNSSDTNLRNVLPMDNDDSRYKTHFQNRHSSNSTLVPESGSKKFKSAVKAILFANRMEKSKKGVSPLSGRYENSARDKTAETNLGSIVSSTVSGETTHTAATEVVGEISPKQENEIVEAEKNTPKTHISLRSVVKGIVFARKLGSLASTRTVPNSDAINTKAVINSIDDTEEVVDEKNDESQEHPSLSKFGVFESISELEESYGTFIVEKCENLADEQINSSVATLNDQIVALQIENDKLDVLNTSNLHKLSLETHTKVQLESKAQTLQQHLQQSHNLVARLESLRHANNEQHKRKIDGLLIQLKDYEKRYKKQLEKNNAMVVENDLTHKSLVKSHAENIVKLEADLTEALRVSSVYRYQVYAHENTILKLQEALKHVDSGQKICNTPDVESDSKQPHKVVVFNACAPKELHIQRLHFGRINKARGRYAINTSRETQNVKIESGQKYSIEVGHVMSL